MIPFQKKTAREILQRLIKDGQRYNLLSDNIDYYSLIVDNKDIESVFVLMFNVWASSDEDVYSDMSDVKDGYNVLKAIRSDLDNLGKLKGISRPDATSCSVDLKFTLTEALKDTMVINYPISVGTNDGIIYSTLGESLTLSEGTTEFYILAFADETGSNQRVSENTLTNLKTTIPGLIGKIFVTNPSAATGGSEVATDDEYREYIENADKIHEKCTRWSFINYLDRYEGLNSYNLEPQWDGTGTVKVIIDMDDETQYHINKITEGLEENVLWANDDVTVVAAEKINLSISINCNVDIDRINPYSATEKEQIKAKIISTILVYVNGGVGLDEINYKGLLIGDDFIPYQLGIFLNKQIPEIKNITISNPTAPVSVNNEEIAFIDSENIEVIME